MFSRGALLTAPALALAVLVGCGDDGGGSIDPTYANVESVIVRSCAFGASCHGGASSGQAMLNFAPFLDAGEPITGAFENPDGSPRPACEYDAMPVVDPGDPDNSWIMIKLVGAVDDRGDIDFTPDPGWVPDTSDPSCPRTDAGEVNFGRPMPFSTAPEPTPLPEAEIEMLRQWIAMGAPGPG